MALRNTAAAILLGMAATDAQMQAEARFVEQRGLPAPERSEHDLERLAKANAKRYRKQLQRLQRGK